MKRFVPAALHQSEFRRFIAGYSLSLIGSAMVPVAMSFTLYEQGRGVSAVSQMLAAEMVPVVVLTLFGGVAADRFPRRRVMAAANLLCLCSQALLALLLMTHRDPLWALMGLMACIGTGTAFFSPGLQGLIPEMVTSDQLQSANALVGVAQSVGGIAGPALGGLLVAVAGGGLAIALDSLSYGICAALLFSLSGGADKPAAGANPLHLLHEGWREFRSRTWLWSIVSQFSVLHLLVIAPVIILGSAGFAHAANGALGWGGLLSLFSLGTIIGAVLAMRLRPRYPARVAMLLVLGFAAMPGSLAAGLPYPVTGTLFVLSGISIAGFSVLWSTIMQTQIPEDRLSRVTAYDTVGSVCLLPVGYVLAAPMQAAFTREGALWFACFITIATTLGVLAIRDVWNLPAAQARSSKHASP